MNRAVFLDRDGTLVRGFPEGETTRGPRTPDELAILPGAALACHALHLAGYLVIAITNQPDLARGLASFQDQCAINNALAAALQITAVYMCPHDGHWCACRKPRPGLIWTAAVERELDLSCCWVVGDRETDIAAGRAAGCQTFKTETNQGITEAVQWILEH